MSDMRKLLESMDKFAGEPEQKPGDQVRGTDNPKKSGKKHGFHGRLVGEGLDELEQELMMEYRMFVEQPIAGNVAPGNPTSPVANINPAGQGTAATNPQMGAGQTGQVGQQAGQATQQAGQTTTNPNQPQKPTQTPQQQAAQATVAKQDLTTNLSNLKTLDPNLNVQKTVAALQKDPNKLGAADAQALGQIANTLEPILQNKAATGSLKSTVQRLVK